MYSVQGVLAEITEPSVLPLKSGWFCFLQSYSLVVRPQDGKAADVQRLNLLVAFLPTGLDGLILECYVPEKTLEMKVDVLKVGGQGIGLVPGHVLFHVGVQHSQLVTDAVSAKQSVQM